MSSPAEIISQALIDLGLVDQSEGWTSFISFLPDEPDEAICVYDILGKPDGRIMRTGERIEHPGVQVRVRAKSYQEGWAKSKAIALALDEVIKLSVVISLEESYVLHNVSRTMPIIPLGIEETGDRRRHHYTINMNLTLTRRVAVEEEPLPLFTVDTTLFTADQMDMTADIY